MEHQLQKGVSASEAKLHFGEILSHCIYGKKEVVIKKHDKVVAVLVAVEQWKALTGGQNRDQEDPPLLLRIRALRAEIKAYQKKNNIKETMTSAQLVRELRDERDAKWDRQILGIKKKKKGTR